MLNQEDLKAYEGFYRVEGSAVNWYGLVGGGWAVRGAVPELRSPKLDPDRYDVLIAIKPKGEPDGKKTT